LQSQEKTAPLVVTAEVVTKTRIVIIKIDTKVILTTEKAPGGFFFTLFWLLKGKQHINVFCS
jgi:hypothetical protein